MKKYTYKLVVSGLLAALSIVLTRVFSGNFAIAGVPAYRLSIGYVPIILAGIICGAGWGCAVGALADVLGFLMFPSGIYFFPITITSMLVGVLPALIVRFAAKAPDWLKALLCVAAVQVLCSMLLQTYWLMLLYGKAFGVMFYPRAVASVATIPIYYLFIYSLLKGLKRARLLPDQPAGHMGRSV